MKGTVENVEISNVRLGFDDHGIFTLDVEVRGDGWKTTFGQYALDEFDRVLKRREGTSYGCQCLMDILNVFEVSELNELVGLNARAVFEESHYGGGRIIALGHIIKNQWFSFEPIADFIEGKYDKNN